jgi:hypothetical protein
MLLSSAQDTNRLIAICSKMQPAGALAASDYTYSAQAKPSPADSKAATSNPVSPAPPTAAVTTPRSVNPLINLVTTTDSAEGENGTKHKNENRVNMQWLTSIDEASKLAKAARRGFVICFVSAATDAPIFSNEEVNLAMRAAGVKEFVKLAQSAENDELFHKYSAQAGTLIFCSPDGSALRSFSGSECSESVIMPYLSKVYGPALAVWLDTHR